MNKQIIYLVITISLLAAACIDGNNVTNPPPDPDNENPSSFAASVDTTGFDTILSWTAATDPDGEPVTYSVFLEGEQVASGLGDTEFILEGLEYETTYSGRVVSSDGSGGSSETNFNFTSREIRIEWQVTFGDTGRDLLLAIEKASDGGFIAAGYSSEGNLDPGNGSDDYRIMKLDAGGNIEWNRQYGGSSSDRAFSVRQTNDDHYIVAGRSYSDNGDVQKNSGDRDYWILQLDAAGELTSSSNFGGDRAEVAYSIHQTADEGFIVAGFTRSSDTLDVSGANNGQSDFWIVKLDDALEIEWEKNYGDTSLEKAQSIKQTPDGGYVVAGTVFENEDDNALSDGWIIKLDAIGGLEKAKSVGGSGFDQIVQIQSTSDKGLIAVGYSTSIDGDVPHNFGDSDYWVIKLDASLNVSWSRNYGGTENDIAHSVYPAADGGYLIAGSSRSSDQDVKENKGEEDVWILKVDAEGNLLWEKNLGGSNEDVAHSILELTEGGIVVAGYSLSNDGDVLENVNNEDFLGCKT